jgi:threonylcarbamoyladenosine tRNA methylthiotransferase MtaB
VQHIIDRVPDVAISTDIIVGFPGETETMFNNCLEFVRSIEFAKVHIFPYSRRAGTPAANYPDQVAESEKKRRAHALQAVADASSLQFHRRFLDREVTVLFETASLGVVEGLTGNYLRVYTAGDSSFEGNLRSVRLERLYQDGLWGQVIN